MVVVQEHTVQTQDRNVTPILGVGLPVLSAAIVALDQTTVMRSVGQSWEKWGVSPLLLRA